MKKEIPVSKIITGAIDTNGNIQSVGGIKQKVLAAQSHEKEVLYVPCDNFREATIFKTGLIVKSIDNVDTLVKEIFD